MNPELVKFLQETLQQGKDFVVEQSPLVVQETLRWGFYSALITAIVACCVLVPSTYLLRLSYYNLYKVKGTYPYDSDPWIGVGVAGIVLTAISSAIVITNITQMVFIHIAPRLYLLDRLSQIVK